MEDLDKVLDTLKDNKAIDPLGLVNELFSGKNIGTNLEDSVLILMNKIKANFREPEFMSMANVTSFWKGKGAKNDIDNERGIFILIVLRMIKDKLIHNDIKKVVSMSDSQVGARNEFSLRNHLFIIYSCLNSANQHESVFTNISEGKTEKSANHNIQKYMLIKATNTVFIDDQSNQMADEHHINKYGMK